MTIEKSGFYYPNKFMRLYLECLDELLGREAFVDLLTQAQMEQFAKHPLPDNMVLSIDFAYLTALQIALENMGRDDLAIEAGRRVFHKGLASFGNLMNIHGLPDENLTPHEKIKQGLKALAQFIMEFSDQISAAYQWDERSLIYTLERCPLCWNRQADHPVCFAALGLLQEGTKWLGKEAEIDMVQCVAKGDEMGKFKISLAPPK